MGERIDLRKAQEAVKKYEYLTRDHPLVFGLAPEEYAVLTKFGTVTFWNVPRGPAAQFIKEISPFVSSLRESYEYTDTIKVHIGPGEEKVSFEELNIKEIDLERIKIVSYVSAQSVALDRYEHEIDSRLEALGKVFENLKATGTTRFRQKALLRQVGHILSVKQNTITNLALFDKPDETWESAELENLYEKLHSEYDLRDRFGILNEKINFLSENNTALLDFISAQKGNFLELIIIILIVVEILLLAPDWWPFFRDLLF